MNCYCDLTLVPLVLCVSATTVSTVFSSSDLRCSMHCNAGGGEGHVSRDCTQEAKAKSCYKCGQEGHIVSVHACFLNRIDHQQFICSLVTALGNLTTVVADLPAPRNATPAAKWAILPVNALKVKAMVVVVVVVVVVTTHLVATARGRGMWTLP